MERLLRFHKVKHRFYKDQWPRVVRSLHSTSRYELLNIHPSPNTPLYMYIWSRPIFAAIYATWVCGPTIEIHCVKNISAFVIIKCSSNYSVVLNLAIENTYFIMLWTTLFPRCLQYIWISTVNTGMFRSTYSILIPLVNLTVSLIPKMYIHEGWPMVRPSVSHGATANYESRLYLNCSLPCNLWNVSTCDSVPHGAEPSVVTLALHTKGFISASGPDAVILLATVSHVFLTECRRRFDAATAQRRLFACGINLTELGGYWSRNKNNRQQLMCNTNFNLTHLGKHPEKMQSVFQILESRCTNQPCNWTVNTCPSASKSTIYFVTVQYLTRIIHLQIASGINWAICRSQTCHRVYAIQMWQMIVTGAYQLLLVCLLFFHLFVEYTELCSCFCCLCVIL